MEAIAADEREHAAIWKRLDMGMPGVEPSNSEAAAAAEVAIRDESWHRAAGQSGTLRAAVFGINDGLVSNLALVMGFAGATTQNDLIVLAGIAGLLAGAFSMAAGEYVSMQSQKELFERQIELEREELRFMPEKEREELAAVYRSKGLSEEEADMVAARLMQDPEHALDTKIREELGLDPDELGSPWGAAIYSFLAFGLGALIPLAPFLLLTGLSAIAISVGTGTHGALHRRRPGEPAHRPQPALQRHPPGQHRRRRGAGDLHRRQPDRRVRGLMGEAALRERLAGEGLGASSWGNGPHDHYPEHRHAYDKVLVAAAGSIVFHLPELERDVLLEAGDRLRPAGRDAAWRGRGRGRRDLPGGAPARGLPGGTSPSTSRAGGASADPGAAARAAAAVHPGGGGACPAARWRWPGGGDSRWRTGTMAAAAGAGGRCRLQVGLVQVQDLLHQRDRRDAAVALDGAARSSPPRCDARQGRRHPRVAAGARAAPR